MLSYADEVDLVFTPLSLVVVSCARRHIVIGLDPAARSAATSSSVCSASEIALACIGVYRRAADSHAAAAVATGGLSTRSEYVLPLLIELLRGVDRLDPRVGTSRRREP